MKTIAFYLPQFHAIPENDQWWGEGFTEWTNVRRALPQFEGHSHPRKSTILGEYDLTDHTVHATQSVMASGAGIDAFCMYFYWFGGKRLLERPVEAWRQNTNLLPYCLSWANESWTRRWDGKEREVLMKQDYAPGYEAALFNDLRPHFAAPHYLRMSGRPVFVVHRIDLVPRASEFVEILRGLARDAGFGDLYVIAAETKPNIDPERFGCDAVCEFPPVGTNTVATAYLRPIRGVSRRFRGRIMSYDRLANYFESRKAVEFIRHRGVVPGWDNTARRRESATIYVGQSPQRYAGWLAHSRKNEQAERGSKGLVFINAWNEWAEGAYLEPDSDHGSDYLSATAGSLSSSVTARDVRHSALWSYPQLRSLAVAAAGSIVNLFRAVIARARHRQ